MLSALVAVDCTLGETVARSLESASPHWQVRRVPAEAMPRDVPISDLVIVDDEHEHGTISSLSRQWSAALLVLGRDLEKPFTLAALRNKALSLVAPRTADSEIVAIDPALRHALQVIERAAARKASVLIMGPTGVGKELLARRVHDRSQRRGPFVPINCAALNEGLAESMLFGHARGAFTGASAAVPGAFAEAEGGTLFLDEVGELDLRMQAKLLRALEDGEVRPLGAARGRNVDVRIVAATNRDLMAECARGAFRSDLYFRLATFVLQVPALQQRPRDLQALIDRFTRKHERADVLRFSPDARALLARYGWPGNVRELRNVIDRVCSLAQGDVLEADELGWLAPELVMAEGAKVARSMVAYERDAIDQALHNATGCVTRAAAELGIHRTTLWRKLKRRGGAA